MPDAALAEVARPALLRHQRRRGPHALLGCRRGGRKARGELGPRPGGFQKGVPGRQQGVEHRLVARLGAAPEDDPLDPGIQGIRPVGEAQVGVRLAGLRHPHEEGAVQGAGRPADRGQQGHARQPEDGGGVAGRCLAQLLDRRREAPLHVGAMVGVADGGVEGGEVVAVGGEHPGARTDPGRGIAGRDPHAFGTSAPGQREEEPVSPILSPARRRNSWLSQFVEAPKAAAAE